MLTECAMSNCELRRHVTHPHMWHQTQACSQGSVKSGRALEAVYGTCVKYGLSAHHVGKMFITFSVTNVL